MARDRGPVVKQSRREGYALHPKAHRYLAKKSHLGSGRPGRGNNNIQYRIQLREKQKVRRLYGLLEKQFRNLFKKAEQKTTSPGESMLIMLESRLDNAVYRSGLAASRRGARQLVSHKHFKLNGQLVNIASIQLKPGDVVTLKDKSVKNAYFKKLDDHSPKPAEIPDWLKVDRKKFSFSVSSLPKREDAEEGIHEQLIIEYYSR